MDERREGLVPSCLSLFPPFGGRRQTSSRYHRRRGELIPPGLSVFPPCRGYNTFSWWIKGGALVPSCLSGRQFSLSGLRMTFGRYHCRKRYFSYETRNNGGDVDGGVVVNLMLVNHLDEFVLLFLQHGSRSSMLSRFGEAVTINTDTGLFRVL